MFRDRRGVEIDVVRWGELYGNLEYRTVADSLITRPGRPDIRIRTLWHGLEPEYTSGEQPFGTAVVTRDGRFVREIAQWSSETDAVAGHERIVAEMAKDG